MFPTRRSLVLSAAFIALAVLVTPERKLRAQPPNRGMGFGQPRSEPTAPVVPADQVRAAFERNKSDRLPPGFEKLVPGLKQHFQKQLPDLDPNVAEPAVRKMLSSPELQSLSPQDADFVLRQAFQNPAVQQKVREAQANAAKSKGGFPPNGPPFNKSRPIDGTIEPQPFLPPDGPPPLLPKTNKDSPPNSAPKKGPFPPQRSKVGPDLQRDPDPKGEPDPKVPPAPMIGPSDVAGPQPLDIRKSSKTGGSQPINPQPPEKLPQPKIDLGDGFRPPGSPDPNENPADAARRKRRDAAAALWERSVGPLDETPVVKRALFDLVEGSDDFKDSEGNSFWDSLSKEAGDGTSFSDWVNKSATGDSWKPDFSWSRFDGGGSSSSSPSGESWWARNFGSSSRSSSSSSPSSSGRSGSSSFGGIDLGGSGGSMSGLLWLLAFAALIIGGLLLWKFLYFRDPKAARSAFDLGGLGQWPVDPRRISTREDLVKAFEYLSVMICGPAARMWTHSTIAATLADLATSHSEAAMILARLYELARYAPLDEPLTWDEIEESRHLVCRLSGVSYP